MTYQYFFIVIIAILPSATVHKKSWWQRNEDTLSKWSRACRDMLLIEPSSATAKQVSHSCQTPLINTKNIL